MSRKNKKKMSNKTKGIIAGVASVCILATAGILWMQQKNTSEEVKVSYGSANVTEGTIASSTLLSGTVKALNEQYVYFDAAKGSSAKATVSVGDQITAGQQLVQYDTATAQSAYDTAVRNLNKVGRQINYLKTYGNLPTTTTSVDEETGEETTITQQPSEEQNAQYLQQLQDLNDSYADAQAEVDKAQEAINQTIFLSDVSGTVVEVNNDIDPNSKNSQVLVHVATEGQLQIKGTVTEYDLANLKKDQAVKIKSKVYPDQEWTGKISYISNYPTQNDDQGSASASNSGAAYEYKVDITSELGALKQGFSVSVEVVNENKRKLVPVTALVTDNEKNYVWVYDENTGKIQKVEVTLGNADAKQQEILTGLEVGQVVITNPDDSLKEGQTIENLISDDTVTEESSKESEVKE
ncbi:HlyD family secretion protein [Streptococcus henryi]|uniref:HlyD family secretion protein n=1 Tax=Streptococcus henryi TaxID=439219 RepID=A0A1G6C5Q6_9STRE|nr:efflux RND transporter periplasmic adaptor subunit [Streptococcus henryi]SDB28187.1 HlyD family secretion protein [Streptococcus henryi]